MNSAVTAVVISTIVVLVVILGLRAYTGIWPGAKIIQQKPVAEDKPTPDTLTEPGIVKFMFFFASWCPHCKDAEPEVASLKQLVDTNNYTYGGHRVIFENVNAYADKGKAALYKIKAYPTIKIETAEKMYEMTGKPTVANFRAFMVAALGPEKSG